MNESKEVKTPHALMSFFTSMFARSKHKMNVPKELRKKRYEASKKLRKVQKLSRRRNRGVSGHTQLHNTR